MRKTIFTAAILCAAVSSAGAADFFSTDKCEHLMEFGARIGVNTSNRTISDKAFPDGYHHESWGNGFDLGVTAAINIRDYLAIQPGFFFATRGGAFSVFGNSTQYGVDIPGESVAQAGKRNSYNFTIPVMALVRFNLTDNVRWNVEAGPYLGLVLSSKISNKAYVSSTEGDFIPLFSQKASTVDFGFKMGTSLLLFSHYYVGIHYMAGCVDAWKDYKYDNISKSFGGCTKAWVFTIGYDL